MPPPTDTRPVPVPYGRNVVERRPRPPEEATAAPKAKILLAATFPRDAEPPKATRREYPTLSKDQLVAFFKAAETEDRFEALFIVWTLAGPRPGELLGLRWSDLRLPEAPGEPRELILRRSWSASRKGAYMRETTKTGKGRPVYLLPEAVVALKAHRLRYLNEKMRYREIWNAAWQKDPRYENLVFPSTAGTPMSRNNLNRRHLKPLLERAGFPP